MNLNTDELPIVLTATIAPNLTGPVSMNPEFRLAEYRQVLQFCQQFAPVIFLENSGYPLERHPEFSDSSRLRVRRFPPSANPERGKGFQEFEMLDAWLKTEPNPPDRWLKITGRYRVLNLKAILAECRNSSDFAMLIDQLARSRFARTYLFCASSAFYHDHLAGLYQRCNDQTGNWIERVLFQSLNQQPKQSVRCFATQPRIQAVAGYSGAPFPTSLVQWNIKQVLRSLNRVVDKRRLWYTN